MPDTQTRLRSCISNGSRLLHCCWTRRTDGKCPLYFGQPLVGFFFSSDFLTASCQLPCSFKRSALGPGVAFFLEWFELFTAFFLLTILNILSLRKWVFVH